VREYIYKYTEKGFKCVFFLASKRARENAALEASFYHWV
jgi:hypothetical protein